MEHNQASGSKTRSILYFRNFIFGVEDSLVSTVGLLSGIAVAHVSRSAILITGVILIFVEAFSMAAGSFLSESSAEEYASRKQQLRKRHIVSSVIMFFSYFVSGFVPLSAYLIWPVQTALIYSISFSLIALFVLGLIGAKISRVRTLWGGVRMLVIGGIAIGIGALAGSLLNGL